MLLGTIAVIAGMLVVACAEHRPVNRAVLERCAASLLVSGIALVALMFPMS